MRAVSDSMNGLFGILNMFTTISFTFICTNMSKKLLMYYCTKMARVFLVAILVEKLIIRQRPPRRVCKIFQMAEFGVELGRKTDIRILEIPINITGTF